MANGAKHKPGEPKPSLFQRVMRERDELRRTVEVVRRGLRGLYRSQIPRMGAALAYRTIFSIIPVLVISLLVFGALVSDNQVESGVERLLNFTGLDQIVIEDRTGPAVVEELETDEGDEPAEEPAADARRLLETEPEDPVDTPAAEQDTGADPADTAPVQGERIDQLIGDLVSRVNSSLASVPTTWIALISIAILIYAALSMLVEVERAFNQIYNARSGRGWLKRLILYWSMLTLGALLLVATFTAGDLFKRWALSFVGEQRALAGLVAFGVTVLISTLLLLVGYLSVPNTRVHFRPALVGAVLAALLWELGKWGFRSYLEYSTNYAQFYGSLALLPLFLLWVYVTWIIVLFGLQVAYALQSFRDWRDLEFDDDTPAVVDPAVILLAAGAVGQRFADGQIATVESVSDATGLSDRLAELMLDRLVGGGVVHRVEKNDQDDGFVLSAPPESIRAPEVLALMEQSTPNGADTRRWLARVRGDAFAGQTLASITGQIETRQHEAPQHQASQPETGEPETGTKHA